MLLVVEVVVVVFFLFYRNGVSVLGVCACVCVSLQWSDFLNYFRKTDHFVVYIT